MRPTTRMMLANRGRESGRGGNMQSRDGGMENRGGNMEYQGGSMEGRNRANMGYANYPTNEAENRQRGGYARNGGDWEPESCYEPQGNYGNSPSNRFRDRRGREHYNNGRFAPMRNGVEVEGDVVFNRIPPIYTPETGYRYEGGTRMIGFGGGSGGGMEKPPMDELAPLREQRNHGHHKSKPMDRETAKEWVHQMHNSDGSVGEHWTYEQASQLMRQKGLNLDPAEFYATINMLWSDYGQVARKTGQDNAEYWADMAKAFLSDADAKPNKLALYYECIVK